MIPSCCKIAAVLWVLCSNLKIIQKTEKNFVKDKGFTKLIQFVNESQFK